MWYDKLNRLFIAAESYRAFSLSTLLCMHILIILMVLLLTMSLFYIEYQCFLMFIHKIYLEIGYRLYLMNIDILVTRKAVINQNF